MLYEHNNGLEFTKLEEEDLEWLKELKNESWFGTHRVAIVNMNDQKKWFHSTSSLVLVASAMGKGSVRQAAELEAVGIFKIDNIDSVNRSCDVGWDVFSEFRGQGLGYRIVEAGVDFCFEILNLNRLDAEILENNKASQKCAEKAGFVLEGARRQAVYRCNQYIDSRIYGVLRDNWSLSYDGPKNKSYTPKDGTK